MTWNYRVLRRSREGGGYTFGIHEVFYGKSGKPKLWTENPIKPQGESYEELAQDFASMLGALQKPVLEVVKTRKGKLKLDIAKNCS